MPFATCCASWNVKSMGKFGLVGVFLVLVFWLLFFVGWLVFGFFCLFGGLILFCFFPGLLLFCFVFEFLAATKTSERQMASPLNFCQILWCRDSQLVGKELAQKLLCLDQGSRTQTRRLHALGLTGFFPKCPKAGSNYR